MLHAAVLARKLGHKRVAAVEFGVAGGNGLLAMERHAEAVRAETGVEVAVYGFDTGKGMPPPLDYRDMPYMWQPGYFAMDVEKLRARLAAAELILGDVAETLAYFVAREGAPPVGFVAIKVAPVNGLRFFGNRIPQSWHEQIFVAHLFAHPGYGTPTSELMQLPLDAV